METQIITILSMFWIAHDKGEGVCVCVGGANTKKF